jgi:hypothetical protein
MMGTNPYAGEIVGPLEVETAMIPYPGPPSAAAAPAG